MLQAYITETTHKELLYCLQEVQQKYKTFPTPKKIPNPNHQKRMMRQLNYLASRIGLMSFVNCVA